MSYMTHSSQEKHFFTLFILSRASDNTTSQNIGATDAWAVPPPQIFGGPSPRSPAPASRVLISFGVLVYCSESVAETWRRVWRERKFFADQDFLNDVFSENISIFTA